MPTPSSVEETLTLIHCSISISECGPSVSTCRNSLPRWSHTDLALADKVYLAKSSTMFAVIPPTQIQNISDTGLCRLHFENLDQLHIDNIILTPHIFAMFYFPHLESCMFVPCRLSVGVTVYTCMFTLGSWWPCVSEA